MTSKKKVATPMTLAEWRNRPKYKKITSEIITSLSDDWLGWAIWDYLRLKVTKKTQRLASVLSKLPAGYTVIYYALTIGGEIGNGGFNQYFFNGYGQYAPEHLEALKRLRAFKHRRILQKAIQIHALEGEDEELQRRYAERTIEAFFSTYSKTGLIVCDKEWFALKDEFQMLQVKYIRKHPELFVTG